MDFGLVSLDGLMNSQSSFTEQKTHGSEFLKQERSSSLGVNENDWRNNNNMKKSRTDDFSTMLRLQQRDNNGQQQQQQQQHMLSFSSPKSDPFSITNSDYYHSAYTRNAGLMNSSIHGALTGSRGPFTPSQWMELEHQALIYKYINANVPIPSNLLIPIRKAFNQGFSGFSNSFRHNTLGWGPFHLGFAGNHDPEPGRCRRTDGKKWRCSRDAVADQKYCERHMNRGRHRSRKPVEGQTGHTVAGSATTKGMPMASPSPALVVSGSGVSNNLNVTQLQVKNLQSAVVDTSSNNPLNRISLNNGSPGGRLQDSQGLSMLSPTMNLKPKDTPFSTLKQHIPCEDSSRSEFGLISSDSLLNRCSYIDSRNFGATPDLNTQESQSQDPLRHFMDDWPKNRSSNSSIAWSEIEEPQIDRTRLSISIPMSTEFSPSSSSPTNEKLALSPLSLGVGSFPYESTQRQANWVPISWESSMGGPLGEVLNHTNNNVGNLKNASSALNLMTDGWDNGGLQMELSPTGVLQKTSFGSLSNSSTGSSPRGETNMLGASFVNSASVPTL